MGVRWWSSNLVIIFGRVNPLPANVSDRTAYDELVLSVESHWTVFPSTPDSFPTCEEDVLPFSLEEGVGALVRLARQDITSAVLGEQDPHLISTLDSGNVLFFNGYHDKYESWNVSTIGASEQGEWLIVAVPESAVAIFSP